MEEFSHLAGIPKPPSNIPPPPRKEPTDSWVQRQSSVDPMVERTRKTLIPNSHAGQEVDAYYPHDQRGYDELNQSGSKMVDSYSGYPTTRKTLVSAPPANYALTNYDYQPVAPRSMAMESYGVKAQFDQSLKSPLEMEVQNVLTELHQEMAIIDQTEYAPMLKNAKRLLKTESYKLENSVDPDWVEVDVDKPIKVTKKILVPHYKYPHKNWVGLILGAKGGTVRNIMEKFKCTVVILGAHSTRDRVQEIELLNSGDPQYAHFASPLHVQVSTIGPAHLAYLRVAHVMKIFNRLLQLGNPEIEGITVSFFSDADKKTTNWKQPQKPKKELNYANYNEDEDEEAPSYEPLEEEPEDYEYDEEENGADESEEPPAKKPAVSKRGGANGNFATRGRGGPNRGSFPVRGNAVSSRGFRGAMSTRGNPNERGRGGGFIPKRGGGNGTQ